MNSILYKRYYHIKERCYNPNNKSYHRYGGRGIKMCDEWLNDYSSFEQWCLSHGFRQDLAIDCIDNDGDYSPMNCRFVTLKENNQKRRTTKWYTINGETKNLQQWCDYYHINRGTVNTRLELGYSIEEALTKPTKQKDTTSLIGKSFGDLTVISFVADSPQKDTNPRWLCQCVCGKQTIVTGHRLKSGHTKSCGHLVSEKAKERMLTNNPMKKKNEDKE